MTTITLPRAVVEEALEALKSCSGVPHWPALQPTIHALRTALAQQADAQQEMERSIESLKAALAEPVQEPEEFDHGIGADRFKVVRGAYWWHVLIGDSPTKRGKFHTQAGAEEMAALLLREFRNGAFVQHNAPPQQAEPLTVERLRDALVASRIIQPAAVEDPEEYDDGLTWFRVEALHRRIT